MALYGSGYVGPQCIGLHGSGRYGGTWEMQIGAGMFVFVALFWLIPLIMAFLSLILKDSTNRWANIVLGIVFTLLNIWHLIMHLAEPSVEPSVHQILVIGSTVVVAALIAWYAWKWPKQEP